MGVSFSRQESVRSCFYLIFQREPVRRLSGESVNG